MVHILLHRYRRAAAKEMGRVLKPGGVLSLTDSVQYGDRSAWDKTLGNFSNFNEPYYLTYIREDLGALLGNIEFYHDPLCNCLTLKVCCTLRCCGTVLFLVYLYLPV